GPGSGTSLGRTGRDQRGVTRLLCFPSGEMLDNRDVVGSPWIGKSIRGDVTACVVDEITGRSRNPAFGLTLVDEEIGPTDDTLFAVTPEGGPGGTEAPRGPGVLKIGGELVVYRLAQRRGQAVELSGCVRGVLRTTPGSYSRGARLEVLPGITVGVLTEGAQESGNRLSGVGFDGFPRIGCVRLEDRDADQAELRIYTENAGGSLQMPVYPSGGGIFVGRYGTRARSFDAGTPVFWHPIRAWDRFAEFSDDPELSFWSFSTQLRDAYAKRLYWSEVITERANLRVLVRLNEGIGWDATSRRIVTLSEDGDSDGSGRGRSRRPPPGEALRYLYRMEDPGGDNFVGAQADRIEIRVFVIYEDGAYEWTDPSAMGWKDKPVLQSLSLEYVQPNRVWRHLDLP
ncbi:MAG: hypothetical protein ACE5JG_11120, partial [Planctomycetota bacterium]